MESPFSFQLDQRVQITRLIRNDGTHPASGKGVVLARPGETGIVIDRGFFLQDIVIYSIRLDTGITIGCMAKELAPLNPVHDDEAECENV